MSEAVIIAIINLVAKVGLDTAVYVLNGLKSATTIDEAIAALEASKGKTWEDYKKAAAAINPPVVPPAPSAP